VLYEAAASYRSIDVALTASLGLDLESLDWPFGHWLDEGR